MDNRDEIISTLLDALVSLLNIEGAALRGGEAPINQGLDVPYHFTKAREAIKQAVAAGYEIK